MSTVTLQQNIPTQLWGAHVVATNVMDGERAQLRVTMPGETVTVHDVVVGAVLEVGGTALTVVEITGGGHDGPPGRSRGTVTVSDGGSE